VTGAFAMPRIRKAFRYARERDRFHLIYAGEIEVVMIIGDHGYYRLTRQNGKWHCDCAYAACVDWPCEHILALRIMRLVPCPPTLFQSVRTFLAHYFGVGQVVCDIAQ